MAMVKKTPVGIENFRDIRKQGFCKRQTTRLG